MTKIMFRKIVEAGAIDPTDWNFEGKLHLVWSHGQSGIEHFVTDEIKYHGGNRASGTLSKLFLITSWTPESGLKKTFQFMCTQVNAVVPSQA